METCRREWDWEEKMNWDGIWIDEALAGSHGPFTSTSCLFFFFFYALTPHEIPQKMPAIDEPLQLFSLPYNPPTFFFLLLLDMLLHMLLHVLICLGYGST